MPDQTERPSVAKARALLLIDDYVANLEQNRASSPSAASDTTTSTTSTTSSATLSSTDNPATPMPGSATHLASYQPPHSPHSPPSSPSPDDQTATAISDDQVRHHLQQYLFGRHHQQQPARAQTPAPQHHSPTMSPHQPLAAAAAPLLPFTHTHRRAHLHPHERLAADIPRRRLHPRQPPLAPGYIVPAARGSALADDVTDYIPSQAWASAANLPIGLGWLEQPGFVVKENYSNNRNEHNRPVPLLRDPLTRRVAEGVLGQPLYDLPILGGAAGRISTQVEAWRVAMWLCYDGRATLHDVSARMRVVRTSEQLRVVEDALAVRVVAWCEEHAGMMLHSPPGVVTERDVRLVGELGEEKVLRNTRWDLWRRVPQRGEEEKEKEYEARKEAEPVFVVQPRATAGGGEGGLGAMWRALSKKEGRCYGEKAAVALGEWQDRERERLTRVPREKKVDVAEYKPEGWLFGTGALRERPNPWDMANMSRDPDWALKRWNVQPFIIPTVISPCPQNDTGAGFHSPYLNGASPTVAAGAFPHPHGQPPDNISNVGHSPPGSAGSPMQNFTAQTSPNPTVPSASSHTPQVSLQSPAQQAPQPTSGSGPQIQSNAAMGLGLSNIHLPNTAQPQYQPSTPTFPVAVMSPNASTTMQSPSMSRQSGPASVGQQQPSGPFTPPLHHAQARPTPATAPVTQFVNMDQESYGRFESQGLVQANADAPTRNAGDSLWPNHFRPPSSGPGT